MLLTSAAIGAAAMAYLTVLIFRVEIFSLYTVFAIMVGAGAGILIAYKVKFR